MSIKTIYVLYEDDSAYTKAISEYIAEGANSVDDVTVVYKPVDEVTIEELKEADGVLLGTCCDGSRPSGKMADFLSEFQDGSYPLRGKVGGVFAVSTSNLNDLKHLFQSLQNFMIHQGMTIVPNAAPMDEKWEEAGFSYGAAVVVNEESTRNLSNAECDLAYLHGRRVAETAKTV
ncbi:NAD(P)H-dependent oxidoreductase [Bacillus taeanensis]|uniref:Flavodoxin-like domain-containing protein n=1 Tax=Bacillus taeanensis TaxID=273032 RepID=A0A366XQF1_9BACI|nr:NAD(P)H-dependent oxidoreductase [Bacillus taeanensis]RBW68147.1 hypothetical protein DS031_18185 [Bacillus taeanensis]